MAARFDTLVVDITDERLRDGRAVEYLRELDRLPARQIILQLDYVSDDLLPKVAAFVRYLATNRQVAICGVVPGQIARLTSLGIAADDLLMGRWRQPGP